MKRSKSKRKSVPVRSAVRLEDAFAILQASKSAVKPVGFMRFTTKKEARKQALIDYVTDPEERDVGYHYRRTDRNYTELVTDRQFARWSKKYCWVDQRALFFADVEQQVLQKLRDRMVQLRIHELDKLEQIDNALFEWLVPLRTPDGEVMRNDEGVPVFPGTLRRIVRDENGEPVRDSEGRLTWIDPVPMPGLDKLIRAYGFLLEKRMLLRGDAIDRTNTFADAKKPTTETEVGRYPVRDLASAAQYLLQLRNPTLKEEVELIETMGSEVVEPRPDESESE